MRRLRPPLVRAAFVLFCSKVFLLGKIDHAEPGFRHVTPHVLLRHIFGALGPSAALGGVGAVLVRLTNKPGHQAQPAREGSDRTDFRPSYPTIIIEPGSFVFTALSQIF
jgi:hypothetical protein